MTVPHSLVEGKKLLLIRYLYRLLKCDLSQMLIEHRTLFVVKVFNFYQRKYFTHSPRLISTPIVLHNFRTQTGLGVHRYGKT